MPREHEGVIKFQQAFQEGDPPRGTHLLELREWRNRLHQWELIGEYPDGTGYGNASHRLPPYEQGSSRFVITGTQTGHYDYMGHASYATVVEFDVAHNRVVVVGRVRASSESLTHGVIYELDPSVRYVFHVHSPEIWASRHMLGLLETREDVTYGTTEMADEVGRLFRETDVAQLGIFAMAGHPDGLVSFAPTAIEAGSRLRTCLTRVRDLLDERPRP